MRAFLVMALVMVSPAVAQDAGNLPANFYPQPACERPRPPGQPPEPNNQAAMQTYNGKVTRFNAQATVFNACMKDYVDKAQTDIAVIQRVVHDAVAAANTH